MKELIKELEDKDERVEYQKISFNINYLKYILSNIEFTKNILKEKEEEYIKLEFRIKDLINDFNSKYTNKIII